MKVSKEFLEFLKKSQQVKVPRRTQGVLENLCFHSGNKVAFTNLHEWITFTIDHDLSGYQINRKELTTILSMYPSDTDITLSIVNEQIQVSGNKRTFYMESYENNNYPEIPDATGVELPIDYAQRYIDCLPYVSRDSTREYITGVYVSCNDVVVTDGKQLYVSSSINHCQEFPPAIIETSKLLNDMSVQRCSITDKCINFSNDNYLIQLGKIEGRFPDYNRILQGTKNSTTIEATIQLTQEQKKTLSKICRMYLTDKIPAIIIDGDQVLIKQDDDVKYRESIDIVGNWNIKVNINYLLTGLSINNTLSYNNSMITAEKWENNEHITYAFVPMRM